MKNHVNAYDFVGTQPFSLCIGIGFCIYLENGTHYANKIGLRLPFLYRIELHIQFLTENLNVENYLCLLVKLL